MIALKYEKNAVLVQASKIKAWVDVIVYERKLNYYWIKFIFFLHREEDLVLRKWQDKSGNCEDAGIIYQDENAEWHITEKYHIIQGSIVRT